ncbi:MAG: C45 family autoproteolytic acyltransferase/hydrolase [Victivallaceae bacterium]|nr:C45 family autoproteolytic acyltransferase/hydrolase [Victivallaceae bacterium]
MIKILLSVILSAAVFFPLTAGNPENLTIVKRADNGCGILCTYKQKKRILFLEGSPEQMGQAHGQLLKSDIRLMEAIMLAVAAGYLIEKKDNFFTRIAEVIRRTTPFIPRRFLAECDAVSKAAGITPESGRRMNYFPEMFHCSGAAVCNAATTKGQVVQARVLDYMTDIRLQDHAALMVFMPAGYNNWVSIGFAGFVGTVTAMNEKGLAMGEMGGDGQGRWDGLPMSFLMRRIMEECGTVEEAVDLMKKVPLTCDYYYILSDKHKNMCGVVALAGSPLRLLWPGKPDKLLPPVPQDCVYFSKDDRARVLSRRLHDNFGKIDALRMIEIIKRPVAMDSNLHDAVFLPESLTFYFADADSKTPACFMPYCKLNLRELIEFYRVDKAKQPLEKR